MARMPLKYSPNGSEIAVRVWKDASFGYVSVEDHGAGIAEEDLRKIFDRFYRADKSRNKGGFRYRLRACYCALDHRLP